VLAVLCGCDIWSATSGEEVRLRVFEYRALRGIFGSIRVEVKGWRKLYKEKLYDL
jgi:hypothetical protein